MMEPMMVFWNTPKSTSTGMSASTDAERTAVAVPAARVHRVHDVPHKGRYRRADARIAEVAVDEIGLDVDPHAADDGRASM